ncbi:MAG: T9SS type A sorting domain-containing protein [Bacteroidota bacterium]
MGLNLRDSNASLAATEAGYVIQKYDSTVIGFEIGNEPDQYAKRRYRGNTYWDTNYEKEYMKYYNTIREKQPTAVFTGPACSSSYKEFTLPFCRKMDTIKTRPLSMLTQHYYGGDTTATVTELIDTLMYKEKLRSLSAEVQRLVHCADTSGIPFRMSECNSVSDGGKEGVSNAYVSALWALDYMYKLAYDACTGVNFHGGLNGAYAVFSREDTTYSARPIAYGILAFQAGSKGRFITSKATNDSINLDSYSVVDGLKNIYTTIINKEKETLPVKLIILKAGNLKYLSAEYLQLSSDSLGDTENVSLGGQKVKSNGTIPDYKWNPLKVDSNTTKIPVPGGSAVVVKFTTKTGSSVTNDLSENKKYLLNLYPNPASEKVTVITDMPEHSVISIYNLQGQLLLQKQVQPGKTDIDIRDLAKGVYILKLYGNAGMEAGRIMKE